MNTKPSPTSLISEQQRLQLMRIHSEQSDISQRDLSKAMGISVGKTHYCLQALIEKGQLTLRFLERKQQQYLQLQQEIAQLRSESPNRDNGNLTLCTMGNKDIVSKALLKRLAVDIARILFKLDVTDAEILDTEHQRIEDRRSDLVARMSSTDNEFILHIEIQNDNLNAMPSRMLRYRSELIQSYPDSEIRQYLIYIGKDRLTMADGIEQSGLSYHYPIIDMHNVDCQRMIDLGTPDALVLAILCDFKGRPEREVLHYLLERLQALTTDNQTQFRECLGMMEILSSNRGLQNILKEEEKMLSRVNQRELPSFQIGMEYGLGQGIEQGIEQGEGKALIRQVQKRFGPLTEEVKDRIGSANSLQIERWLDNILDARSLDEVFKDEME